MQALSVELLGKGVRLFFAEGPGSDAFLTIPGWQALILFLIALAILVYALIRNAATYELPVHATHAGGHGEHATHLDEAFNTEDLTIVEGIGPKTQAVFYAAGIKTLRQLAEADVNQLDGILDAAGLRLGDPGTWPEQARLAADGMLDELAELQQRLKGGRAS